VKGLNSYRGLEVEVIDNDVERALRQLKKKINDEGLFKTLKLKRSYEKPSEYRRRKERESRRRRNRMLARRKARVR
jgi:small subunit ribosomal protein S21